MYGEQELTRLFTDYFDDRLSPAEIDELVADVRAGIQGRARVSSPTHLVVSGDSRPAPTWSPQFAI